VSPRASARLSGIGATASVEKAPNVSDAYGLSLIAILAALSFAILRVASTRRSALLWLCVAGVFAAGYVLGHLQRREEDPWATAGPVRAQAPVVTGNAGLQTAAPADSLDPGLSVKKGGQIAVDIFDVADKPAPGQLDVVELPKGKPLTVAGWAADPDARSPCKAVFLMLGKARLDVPYGLARADVAAFFHDPAYLQTGFSTQIPTLSLAKGSYPVTLECLAAGNKLFITDHPRTVVIE
jgi:hypothetical protein